MSLTAKVLDIVGGGLFNGITDLAKTYFPPNMSEEQKKQFELGLMKIKDDKMLKVQSQLIKTEQMYNERIMTMDGTAEQLRKIWFIGPLLIFARAIQRPLWGFGTLILDYQVFSGKWTIIEGSRQDTCFLLINLIILIFLFGEKTFKNIAPLVERLLSVKK